MALRARKVSGAFEKQGPEFNRSSKKQSLNAYHFLGLSGNLYIMIKTNWSNGVLRVDSDGKMRGGGRGEANVSVPACRIFRRGIGIHSSFSPRSGEAELVQLRPLQVTHAAEQSSSFFFCMNRLWEPKSGLQLHLTNSNKDARAAGGSVVMGRSLPCTSFQPQSCGWNATPLNCCTWW